MGLISSDNLSGVITDPLPVRQTEEQKAEDIISQYPEDQRELLRLVISRDLRIHEIATNPRLGSMAEKIVALHPYLFGGI